MRPSSDTEATRLAGLLRHEILEGKYAADEQFPSLRTLAERHSLGLCAVRAAIDILVGERLLHRRARSGTFIRRQNQPVSDSQRGAPIQCVTVFERPTGTLPSFVRVNYLEGYTQALDKHHARMRIMGLPADLDQIERALSARYPLHAQGAILVNITEEPVLRWFREHKIPFVVQNYTQYDREFLPAHHSVVINKAGGAFAATRHLIGRGHTRIGYAGRLWQEEPQGVHSGFMAAMTAAGLEMRTADVLLFHSDDPLGARALALPVMQGRALPSAIVAQTDSTAIGIIQAAGELGIRVPDDLSVVGFNDQIEAASCEPPLTTVSVPRIQLGYTAMEVLMATAVAPDATPVQRVLECQLIERESVADATPAI